MDQLKNQNMLFDRLVCLIFPPRCVICQEIVHYEELFCGKCTWQETGGKEISEISDNPSIDRAAAVFFFEGDICNAIYAMKRYHDKRMTDFYCDRIIGLLVDKWRTLAFDAVTCVPSSKRSIRKQGFNHAALLAKGVAERAPLPYLPDLLERSNDTRRQRSLNREERLHNAFRSYHIKKGANLSGKRILLIDDVLTTGATVVACANSMRDAGASSVSVAAVCRTRDDFED